MRCFSLSKNNEPLNFWIISCDYFAFFSPRARLLFQPEKADRSSKLFRSPVNCSRHACFDVCRLYSLVCCCRRSEDRGRGGGVHVGGKPGQHQLWGGGSPRSLGDLVQRRPPAALCQLHQLEDPQHANQQLPGGLLHLPDIQKKKTQRGCFCNKLKAPFFGRACLLSDIIRFCVCNSCSFLTDKGQLGAILSSFYSTERRYELLILKQRFKQAFFFLFFFLNESFQINQKFLFAIHNMKQEKKAHFQWDEWVYWIMNS